jgi:hypothetical protein
MSEWRSIEAAPDMCAILLFHEYFSHGRVRHGYRDRKGTWQGVNATGTEAPLGFDPTHWMPLPAPPQ